MKKNIIITKSELKKIIKEGVERLHRKTLIENRINQINEELAEMGFGKQDSEYKKNFDDMMGNPLDNMDFMKEGEIMGDDEYKILEAYLEAALWTEEEEIGPASISDISDESKEKANQDVLEFMSKAGSLLDGIDPEQVGHDLWLTRNGHGAGFWDRGLGDVGESLSEIAREMGGKYLYRGDDGKIYID